MTFFRILPIIIFIVILLLFLDYDNVPVATSVLILVPMFYEGTYQGIKNIDTKANKVAIIKIGSFFIN